MNCDGVASFLVDNPYVLSHVINQLPSADVLSLRAALTTTNFKSTDVAGDYMPHVFAYNFLLMLLNQYKNDPRGNLSIYLECCYWIEANNSSLATVFLDNDTSRDELMRTFLGLDLDEDLKCFKCKFLHIFGYSPRGCFQLYHKLVASQEQNDRLRPFKPNHVLRALLEQKRLFGNRHWSDFEESARFTMSNDANEFGQDAQHVIHKMSELFDNMTASVPQPSSQMILQPHKVEKSISYIQHPSNMYECEVVLSTNGNSIISVAGRCNENYLEQRSAVRAAAFYNMSLRTTLTGDEMVAVISGSDIANVPDDTILSNEFIQGQYPPHSDAQRRLIGQNYERVGPS